MDTLGAELAKHIAVHRVRTVCFDSDRGVWSTVYILYDFPAILLVLLNMSFRQPLLCSSIQYRYR